MLAAYKDLTDHSAMAPSFLVLMLMLGTTIGTQLHTFDSGSPHGNYDVGSGDIPGYRKSLQLLQAAHKTHYWCSHQAGEV